MSVSKLNVSKFRGKTVAAVALVASGMLAFATSAPAQLPLLKDPRFPAAGTQKTKGKRINVKRVRIVRGRVMLLGFDNKERPLPDGVYRTTNGKQIAVTGGAIRYIVLPPNAADDAKPAPGAGQGSRPGKKQVGNPKRARYRVTINGFRVHNETWDDASESDGKGDEVFLYADVKVANRNKNIGIATQRRSKTMGDVNGFPQRVRAGTRSSLGGIRSGDDVPGANPWRRRGRPQPDRLPMLLWEGELVEGENAVVIMPTIWEWDGGADVFSDWVGWARQTSRTLKNAKVIDKLLGEQAGNTVRVVFEANELALGIALSLQAGADGGIMGKKADRPIGLQKRGNRYVFSPKVVALNYNTAQEVVNTNFGLGKGVIEINYQDAPRQRGNYSLYLQVERL